MQFPDAWSRHSGETQAPLWWSDTEAYIGALHLFKLRDVLVFPTWGVVVSRDGNVMRLTMEEARYATPDLAELPFASRHRNETVLTLPERIDHLRRALIVMPFGAMMNYGHFILDALASLAAIDATKAFEDFPVLVPPLKPWQTRHFALMGAEPSITHEPVVWVDEVIYTSAMHHFLHNPNLNYRDLRARQLTQLNASRNPPESPRNRLYLSRGALDRRTMTSEPRLLRALRRSGFTVIDTGQMSVDEQITRLASAEAVVGSAGAAFANVLYCRPGTLVVEIQPKGMENHWLKPLCLINGLNHAAWFCDAQESNALRPEQGMRFSVDVERFLDFAFSLKPLAETRNAGSWSRRIGRIIGFDR